MTESNNSQNQFGNTWTKEKLNIFIRYLEAYSIALKNQSFELIYIDAFAGCGEIEIKDGSRILGSAIQALSANGKFDHYYFNEKDRKKADELKAKIETEYPQMKSRVTVSCGDANEQLKLLINKINWRQVRGLIFLDPFATEVDWSTLSLIARTGAIDVWYLFPFGALNRLLPNDYISEKDAKCVNRLLGDEGWREEFYKPDPQISLFNFAEDNSEVEKPADNIKTVNPNMVRDYILKRLKSTFPCVSDSPKLFRNSKNAPLFLFCFAVSSPNPKAQKLALRISSHLLSRKRSI